MSICGECEAGKEEGREYVSGFRCEGDRQTGSDRERELGIRG